MKRILITGCSSGYGLETARHFHAGGWTVIATMRNPAAAPLEPSARLRLLPLDVTDDDSIAAAIAAAGPIDVLVNNAGVITRGAVDATSDAVWDLSVGVNVQAPFRICRAAIPLLGPGSAIVNVASCWGLRPGPGHAVYCMTKAAIASLTQCMGMDHAHQGIRINAVAPNEVNTPIA